MTAIRGTLAGWGRACAFGAVLLCGLMGGGVSDAQAATCSITASPSGAQEVPPVATPGTGSVTGSYDTDTRLFSWSGSYSGLTSSATAQHFHVGATGTNGPILIDLPVSSSFTGSQTLSTNDGQSLVSGLFYFNAHTTANAGGEIRGQLNVQCTEAPAAPSVTGISPNSGNITGGTSVSITGTNLTGATAVRFGGNNATSFTVSSATQIIATSPAGSTGTVNVTVTTPGGTSGAGSGSQFTYGAFDSAKARAIQNVITPMIAFTSGQAITGAIVQAIADAFGVGAQPITVTPDGVRMNFGAEPGSTEFPICTSHPTSADSNANSNVNSFASTERRPNNHRVHEAHTALAAALNVNKAPPAARVQRDWSVWADLRGTGWRVSDTVPATNVRADITGQQLNVTVGVSRKLTPEMLVGVIFGHENFNYDVASLGGSLKGHGETVGGYFARQLGTALRFDMALAWSAMSYDVTGGTASGSINGSRWLASGGLTGMHRFGALMVEPSARVFALWEHQRQWTDSLGTVQDERNFSAGRASGGAKVAHPFMIGSGSFWLPYAGFYADYRFMTDNAIPVGQPIVAISDGWSGRVIGGATYTSTRGFSVTFGGEYGGLGANYEIWSGHVRGIFLF